MPQSLETRLLSTALAKLAYCTPSTGKKNWKSCPNYACFSKLCSSHQNYATWFLSKTEKVQGEQKKNKNKNKE